MIVKFLQSVVKKWYYSSSDRCCDWTGKGVADLKPQNLLDVGCGDGSFLFRYLNYKPCNFCGVEAAPELTEQAEARGIKVQSFDLNGVWPYPNNTFEVIHCSQVIEHIHNTRLFIQEMFRVLKPGGTVFISSENLTSFLNLSAMFLGYTPFSLICACGWYIGNPIGLHYQEEKPEYVPVTSPAFSGVTGHNRVLSVYQAKDFFERVGFMSVVSKSVGLMPIPDFLGVVLEKWMYRRGHWLLVRAQKPSPK